MPKGAFQEEAIRKLTVLAKTGGGFADTDAANYLFGQRQRRVWIVNSNPTAAGFLLYRITDAPDSNECTPAANHGIVPEMTMLDISQEGDIGVLGVSIYQPTCAVDWSANNLAVVGLA
jgi:hypothetical protein